MLLWPWCGGSGFGFFGAFFPFWGNTLLGIFACFGEAGGAISTACIGAEGDRGLEGALA